MIFDLGLPVHREHAAEKFYAAEKVWGEWVGGMSGVPLVPLAGHVFFSVLNTLFISLVSY